MRAEMAYPICLVGSLLSNTGDEKSLLILSTTLVSELNSSHKEELTQELIPTVVQLLHSTLFIAQYYLLARLPKSGVAWLGSGVALARLGQKLMRSQDSPRESFKGALIQVVFVDRVFATLYSVPPILELPQGLDPLGEVCVSFSE